VTRRILLIGALLLVIGTAALYFPLDFLRPSVERALERGLGRKVDVSHVYINLFGVPGFTFEDVTIHEDPRAGIEPFAYVPSLNAGIRVFSLLHHRLVFSSLSLGDATINVVKTNDGIWNFQLLPQQAGNYNAPPAVEMRGGRVNFKFGETKSVFYFNDADLDVTPYGKGSVEVRFGGAPSRTDRAMPDFGHFFVRGNWTPGTEPRLDVQVELERGALDEISRLIDPRGFGIQGFVSLRTQLSGPPAALQIAGELQLEEVRRWDVVQRSGNWRLPLKGTLDLEKQRMQLVTAAEATDSPLAIEFRGSGFLTRFEWEAGVRVQQIPLGALIDTARQMGGEFPDKLTADGSVSGEVDFSHPGGITGQLELRDASFALPDAKPLRAPSASVAIREGAMSLESTTVEIGDKESAELQASYRIEEPRGLDLRITTRGMNVADMRSFGLAAIPLLDKTAQGTWRGWARYRSGEWSGEYDLQNARIAVEGLADSLRIQSASVKLNGKRASVGRLRAKAGKIAFTGDYTWDPEAVRPHRFNLAIPEAEAPELARLFAPTFAREQGFLARTLRLAPSSAPEWLKDRRADGTVSVGVLSVGGTSVRLDKTRLLWDATTIRLAGVEAHVMDGDTDQAGIAGDLEIALQRSAPRLAFDGRVVDVPYKGGTLDFEGTLSADGLGSQILETARADGRVRGRSIGVSPDSEFRAVTACFSLLGSVWKLGEVEALQGADTFTGSGVLQADGKLVLDLTRSGRAVRVASAP
jgi:hypothetical protein